MSAITEKVLENLEAELKRGQYVSVRDFLRTLNRNEIPDSLILPVSQLARRIDYPVKGLALLRDRVIDLPPSVRPEPREVVEYAACLLKIGGVSESIRLLQLQSCQHLLDATKYLAYAQIHQWNYEAAIPLLRKYLSQLESSSYGHLLGSLNLAASLNEVGQYNEAITILDSVLQRTDHASHSLIIGNAYELLAQSNILTSQWQRADECIAQAGVALKNAPPRYALYLEKWVSIAALLRNPSSAEALKSLREVGRSAVTQKCWEVVRECELFEALVTENESLFHKVYIGTPYEALQRRMLAMAGARFSAPSTYTWCANEAVTCIDLSSGKTSDGAPIFKKDQALHRAAKALALDFYAPRNVAQLFCEIFPDEKYHHESSPHRVQELVRRIKSTAGKKGLRIEIEGRDMSYRVLLSEGNVGFVTHSGIEINVSLESAIDRNFKGSAFTLRDLAAIKQAPHTSVYRELKELVSSGRVVATGTGKLTKYILIKASTAA